MNFGSIIHNVLRAKYKNCEYVCGETYESLQWLDKNVPKPTIEQLLTAIEDYKTNQAKYDYKLFRMKEYPPVEQQLDILYHQGLDAWKSHIKAVKDKYPKENG